MYSGWLEAIVQPFTVSSPRAKSHFAACTLFTTGTRHAMCRCLPYFLDLAPSTCLLLPSPFFLLFSLFLSLFLSSRLSILVFTFVSNVSIKQRACHNATSCFSNCVRCENWLQLLCYLFEIVFLSYMIEYVHWNFKNLIYQILLYNYYCYCYLNLFFSFRFFNHAWKLAAIITLFKKCFYLRLNISLEYTYWNFKN